jgi:ribose 5-phosphate isomerase B
MQKLLIASDHAGFALKTELQERLRSAAACGHGLRNWNGEDLSVEDLGPANDSRVDYPDFADLLVRRLSPTLLKTEAEAHSPLGVLICGSGQGMAMRANRQPWIRAALCWNPEVALLSREHNDANVLCLPGRLLSGDEAWEILQVFLKTGFAGGRHQDRIAKLAAPIDNENK